MTGPIDRAYVEFEAHTDGLERDARSTFDDIERLGEMVTEAIDRAFESMTDQVVNQFEQLRREADLNMDALADTVDRVGGDIGREIRDGTESAERSFDSLRRHADSELERVDRHAASVSSSVRGHFGGMSFGIGGAGAAIGAVGAMSAGLTALTTMGLKSAGTMEQVQISMNSLTGSAAAGAKQFKDLQQFAAQTPFEFSDLTGAAARFDAFAKTIGMTQQQLIPFMTTVGNVVSVTGGGAQSFNSITLAMGQMASAGKLSLDNINQINDAVPGFNSVAAIAAARGESAAKVMDEISAGTISAKDGIAALLQGMNKFPGAAGAMAKQSETLLGVFSTFKDTVSISLTNAFQPVIPSIKNTLTQITPVIGQAINGLAPALGGVLTSLMSLAGPLVSGLSAVITPLLNGLSEGLKFIGPALAPLGQALGGISKALAPVLGMAGQLIGALGTALAPVIAALTPVITSLVSAIQPIIGPFAVILQQIGGTLAQIIAPIAATLGKVFAAIGPPLGEIVNALGTALAPVLAVIGPLLGQLLAALDPIWPVLGQLLQPIVQLIIALTPLIQLLAQLMVVGVSMSAPLIRLVAILVSFLVSKAIAPLLMLIANGLTALLAPLSHVADWFQRLSAWINNIKWGEVGHAIVNGLGAAVSWLGSVFSNAWHAVTNTVSTAFNRIRSYVASFPAMLRAYISAAWTAATLIFRNGVNTAISIIASLPGRARSALGSLRSSILGVVSGIGSWLYSAGQNLLSGLINGIQGAVGWAIDRVKGAMGSIVSGALSALGVHSPSTVFAEIGKYSIQGYVQGMHHEMRASDRDIVNIMRPTTTVTSSITTNNIGGGGVPTVIVRVGERELKSIVVDTLYDNPQDVTRASQAGSRQLLRR